MTAANRIAAIQRILEVRDDGVAGPVTEGAWTKLKEEANTERFGRFESSDEPAWLRIARGELGQSEISGSADNPRIVEYHSATTLKATDDETAWCSSFANWSLLKSGVRGTGSAMARSFLDWGTPLPTPREGCIVVFRRGQAPKGHVAFFLEFDASMVRVLGGNQGNRVSIASFPRADVLGFRWPKEVTA